MTGPRSVRRAAYLQALGIDSWVPRGVAAGSPASSVAPSATRPPGLADPVPAPPVTPDDWASLESEVAQCRRCGLHAGRTQTVFGVGDRQARWMVVGEAPGAEEDLQGEPFVGAAGQLLNAMLQAIGLPRASVYSANVLKCRPPENRDPAPAEVAQCLPYLHRQMQLLRPTLILVLGRVAAHNLLGTDDPISRLRGQVHRFGPLNTPLVVTYHPAYLLRNPADKRKAWEDLKFARRVYEESSGVRAGLELPQG